MVLEMVDISRAKLKNELYKVLGQALKISKKMYFKKKGARKESVKKKRRNRGEKKKQRTIVSGD